MSSSGDRQYSSRKSLHPDPSQTYENWSGETPEVIEICVKEETLDLDTYNHGHVLNISPEVSFIKAENPDNKDYLYCEVCKSFFFNKCEVHGAPLYIADTPVPLGAPDRARQTLPPGLEIQKSSIPDAGLGVFNKGETVPAGAHFGPYQGELVDREEAMNSGYSWVIHRNRQFEEYIDGTREIHANWMRYVNCARNDEEKNLVAFQYRGGILYRCCQPIYPGQELLVYYEEEYAKELNPVFVHLWNKKCSMNETHNQRFHYEEYELQIPSKDSSSQSTSFDTLISDNSHSDVQMELHYCSKCGKSFNRWRDLYQHQCIHTGERLYLCSQCGKSFNRQNNLQTHQRIHTGEKPYHCLQCGKSFSRLSHLQRHQQVHTGEKPYHCSDCGKSFNRQSNLQLHERIHTGERLYHCSQCRKSFNRQSNLQLHQRVHTGEKPYHCVQCRKSFIQQSHLQIHQRVHTGEKPYHCLQCGKCFTQQSHLQRHERIHAGNKPYQCSQCGKTFTYSVTLNTHKCNNSKIL